jgi:hypothetical protein
MPGAREGQVSGRSMQVTDPDELAATLQALDALYRMQRR